VRQGAAKMAGQTERQWREHYNRTARQYDGKERLWGVLFGYSDAGERRKMVDLLQLKSGQRLLEVSVGTGSNLEAAMHRWGLGLALFGADISRGMLNVCREKLASVEMSLVESDAAHLPFKNDSFDGLLHFGGLSQFGDKRMAVEEMVRVVRPNGRLVVGDVGIEPGARRSIRKRVLLRANPRYASEPPVELLSTGTKGLRLHWIRNGTCYVIESIKA